MEGEMLPSIFIFRKDFMQIGEAIDNKHLVFIRNKR